MYTRLDKNETMQTLFGRSGDAKTNNVIENPMQLMMKAIGETECTALDLEAASRFVDDDGRQHWRMGMREWPLTQRRDKQHTIMFVS